MVSETGGLLVMTTRVLPGHSLLITNRATQEERECRVAYVGANRSTAVAVEFIEPRRAFGASRTERKRQATSMRKTTEARSETALYTSWKLFALVTKNLFCLRWQVVC